MKSFVSNKRMPRPVSVRPSSQLSEATSLSHTLLCLVQLASQSSELDGKIHTEFSIHSLSVLFFLFVCFASFLFFCLGTSMQVVNPIFCSSQKKRHSSTCQLSALLEMIKSAVLFMFSRSAT